MPGFNTKSVFVKDGHLCILTDHDMHDQEGDLYEIRIF